MKKDQQNLILFVNNTIHTLNMLLGHRYIWHWLKLNFERAEIDRKKFLIGSEIAYLDAIEPFLMNDIVLKLHGLLEERGNEDYVLNKKFGLSGNKKVEDNVSKLRECFDLETLYHIRNRYVAHLDADHKKRNKNSVPECKNPDALDIKFSEMMTINNLEKGLLLFCELFESLEGKKDNSLDDIKKGSDEFWDRYRIGIKSKSGLQ